MKTETVVAEIVGFSGFNPNEPIKRKNSDFYHISYRGRFTQPIQACEAVLEYFGLKLGSKFFGRVLHTISVFDIDYEIENGVFSVRLDWMALEPVSALSRAVD